MKSEQGYYLITLFEFGERENIDLEDAMLQSVVNAGKYISSEDKMQMTEMNLAIAWKKIQRARTRILTNKTIVHWKDDDLDACLEEALCRGLFDFVELLLDFGASFQRLEKFCDIKILYKVMTEAGMTKWLPHPTNLRDPMEWYRRYMPTQYAAKKKGLQVPNKLLRKQKDITMDSMNNTGSCLFMQELLLWSVFTNQPDIAESICYRTNNPIVTLLFISKIYRTASRTPRLKSEKKTEYKQKEKDFAQHAAAIVDRCFDVDEKFALELIRIPSKDLFNRTPLKLAQEINSRAFISTKTVQKYVDEQWYGNINGDAHRFVDILTFTTCIFPFLLLIPNVCDSMLHPPNKMKDLVFFVYFILIFLFAYMVTSFSLITTRHQVKWKGKHDFEITQNGTNFFDWKMLRDIVDWGAWKVYGQIDMQLETNAGNGTEIKG
ncbi:unnamed protein product [Didymodactylos carnosus]|uniref:TRPM-like domain-containing protein n=1 Tax=Didymodactylos carnosus TaxID=1234261 RepID=A0A814T9F0_9BILA|nr:unnamed protein product [Didymodactylos carnosus]CAF1155267.1 unnamed protein product [Didymodactylos carnosus]CAF3729646.1 unnamed protein product [Didymodactylos carnosus]CAF3918708.1 unnamed protein product [Didymodactylos carnosus]